MENKNKNSDITFYADIMISPHFQNFPRL